MVISEKSKKTIRGQTLVDALLAVAIIGIVAWGLMMTLKFVTLTFIKAREQSQAASLSERFFTRLNNIPYPYIFAADSNLPSYNLTGTFGPVTAQVAAYPYRQVFDELQGLLKSARFDRFVLTTKFMLRDLSDLDSDGETTDLRYYTDSDANGIDDYDSGVRYTQQNADGDFWDIFGSPEITEEPHTRLKEATLKIYKGGQVILEEQRLISWEKFTGVEGKAAGATLKLVVSAPSENSALYDLSAPAQLASFSLAIAKSYPAEVAAIRADAGAPLSVVGETDPNALVGFRLEASTGPVLDTLTSSMAGDFSGPAMTLTGSLTEGKNKIFAQATKDVYYSPWNITEIIRDINPPAISGQTPTGAVKNRQPYVRAILLDSPVAPGKDVSGVNASVISLFIGTVSVNYNYDSQSGLAGYVDSVSGLPPVLSTQTYTVRLEGGDNAFYKAASTWTLTPSPDSVDASAPSVSSKSPIGIAGTNPPTISCDVFDNQSGIILDTVELILDGAVVVSSTMGNLASSLTPLAQQDGVTVSYTPSYSLPAGGHNVTVRGSHWAASPSDKVSSTDTWSFNVP